MTAFSHRALAGATPTCLAKTLWTADLTSLLDTGYRLRLGAADGSGAILTFGDVGLQCAPSTAIALIPVGTGQVCEVYFTWDE